MTARRRADPAQLDLFGPAAASALPMAYGAASWVGMYWPQYAAGVASDPRAPSPHFLWALEQRDLSPNARALLLALADAALPDGSCRLSLRALAQASGMVRNTCKRHLATLLDDGLVTIRQWTERTIRDRMVLGYEFRLIVDVDDRAVALAEGFLARRPMRIGADDAIG